MSLTYNIQIYKEQARLAGRAWIRSKDRVRQAVHTIPQAQAAERATNDAFSAALLAQTLFMREHGITQA